MPTEWDIWLCYVEFDDGSGNGKSRPILIFQCLQDKYEAFYITTKGPRDEFDYSVKHFKRSGLNEPSYIRIENMLEVKHTDLKMKLGRLWVKDIYLFQEFLEGF